jgi:hypothetical protein
MSSESNNSAIQEMIDATIEGLHTCIPAVIVIYDGLSATVKPAVDKSFNDGTFLPTPTISNVPVRFLQTPRGGITTDLLPGDPGLLFFSERDASVFKKSGALLPTPTRRKFDYNDAFFMPCEMRQIIPNVKYAPLSTKLFRTDLGFVNMENAADSLGVQLKDLTNLLITITTVGSPTLHTADPVWAAQVLALQIRIIALTGGI